MHKSASRFVCKYKLFECVNCAEFCNPFALIGAGGMSYIISNIVSEHN